jgi:di/tricarboxylate transporter
MVLAGVAETVHGLSLVYGPYLLLHGPVNGLLKIIVLVLVISWLFAENPATPEPEEKSPSPLSLEEWRLLLILLAALGLWATDFLHGVSPAWVALGAALLCLLPRVGLIPVAAFDRELSFRPLFYVGGILGVGAVLVDSGLSTYLGEMLLAWGGLKPQRDAQNFAILVVISTLLGLVGTVATIPVVIAPLAGDVAQATGLALETILMIPVIGYSTALFPYSVGPIYVAMQLGKVSLADGTRLMLLMAVIGLLLLTPLNYLWWRWLGYFT